MRNTHRARANENNSGGNLMSSNKGALRRLSLLAGSSLIAASLSAVAFAGASLAPSAAHAANECVPEGVDPSANGAASDSYACAEGTYDGGITYDSEGDLAVTATGFVQVGPEGVNLTGNGADNVTWDSSGGFIYGGFGAGSTIGAVIDATADSGDLNIAGGSVQGESGINATTTTGDISVTGGASGVVYGIRTTSTGGGDIDINGAGTTFATNEATNGIEATTAGGDISITTSAAQGRLRSILAQTSGDGGVELNINGDVKTVRADGGNDPVVEVVAGTSGAVINLTGGRIASSVGGFDSDPDAIAIQVSTTSTSAAAVNIQNNGGFIVGGVDFSGVTSGGVNFANSGTGYWAPGGASVFSGGADAVVFASTLQDTPLPGMPQNRVAVGASIDFGAGDDLIDIQTGLNIAHRADAVGGGDVSEAGAILEFGAGADTVINVGVLSIDGPVIFSNLETFDNSGLIYLGSAGFLLDTVVDFFNGDIGSDDILSMQGTTFTGSGVSRIIAAAHFDTTTQVGCATPTGAGDCLDLRGGATAGSTLITLLNAGDDAELGGFNPVGVTIVDVNGGTSAAGHFTLDPNSQGYIIDPVYGPSISRPGLFVYPLVYDAEAQRHSIVGLPRSEALEYVVLGSAAQSIWYMTSAAVTDRQTDLREGTEASVWMKVSGEYSKRDIENTVGAYAESFTLDNSYKLYAGTLMAGMDFITGHSGGYDYVLGAQIGYVGSTFDLDASRSNGQFTGATGGVYGSIWDGALFVDGTLNTNFLTLDYDAPGIGSKTTTWLRSVGAQLEGGRRFMLTDKIFAEPLATVAFVNTTFEEISLDGGEVTPDDASSRRAALGLRVGADMFGGPLKVRYFVTGRAWNEFGGENKGVVLNPGQDLVFSDDASGSFGEAQAGVSLFNDAQTIAGFLTSGVKFKDGYNAVDLDLGLRLRW